MEKPLGPSAEEAAAQDDVLGPTSAPTRRRRRQRWTRARSRVAIAGHDARRERLLLVVADDDHISGLGIKPRVTGPRSVRNPATHAEATIDSRRVVPEVVGAGHGVHVTAHVRRVQAGLSIGPSNGEQCHQDQQPSRRHPNRVRTDKASGIVNDPNDWATEHDDPTNILELVGRVVTVSMRTLDIVETLPPLDL